MRCPPTGRPKDGGRDTESKNSMTTITMTKIRKKVMLGTVDLLESAGRGMEIEGSEDAGSVDGFHGVSVGLRDSVRMDVEGFKSGAYIRINTKRRRQMTTTEDNDDSTTSHAQRWPLDAPARDIPPRAFLREVQCPKDREWEIRGTRDVRNGDLRPRRKLRGTVDFCCTGEAMPFFVS